MSKYEIAKHTMIEWCICEIQHDEPKVREIIARCADKATALKIRDAFEKYNKEAAGKAMDATRQMKGQ